jgi:hypothetical protein
MDNYHITKDGNKWALKKEGKETNETYLQHYQLC